MKFATSALLALAAISVSAAPAESGEELFEPSLAARQDSGFEEVAEPSLAGRATTYPTAADIKGALAAHNAIRAKHKVKPLTWDTTLVKSAQSWANNLAKLGKLQHSGPGENLYYRYPPTDHDLTLATNAFNAEEPNYHNELIPKGNFSKYGHYTQVVWNTTQKVGMALTRDGKGHVFVVAHYSPVGNWVGERPF